MDPRWRKTYRPKHCRSCKSTTLTEISFLIAAIIACIHTLPQSSAFTYWKRQFHDIRYCYSHEHFATFQRTTSYKSLHRTSSIGTTKDNGAEDILEDEEIIKQSKSLKLLQNHLNFAKREISPILFSSKTLTEACSSSNDDEMKLVISYAGKSQLKNMILKHPDLVANVITSDTLKQPMDILRQSLNLTSTQTKTLEKKMQPEVLQRMPRSEMQSKLHFLQNHLPQKQTLQKMILTRPQLLSYSTSNLNTTMQFFKREVRLNPREIGTMLRLMPLVLTYSVDKKLRPAFRFLVNEVGCSEIQARRIVCRYPQVLSRSLDKALRPKIKLLEQMLHLKNSSDVTRIVYLFPPTLWLSHDNLSSKILYLQQSLNLSTDEIRDILVTMPQLLGLSIESNVQPKILFLKQVLKGELLKEYVIYQPALLAYSLEKRIKPRIESMLRLEIQFAYCPPYLMSVTDEKFYSWLDMQAKSWSVESETL